MVSKLYAAILGSAVSLTFTPAANAYPIDCAIALCLPGGFPASAECTAAKVEVIRRITPPTIEPPLQLWNCPMNTGANIPGLDADGLTPEMRQYRAGIEVWMISRRVSGGSSGRDVQVTAIRQSYNENGDFVSDGVKDDDLPAWLNNAMVQYIGFPLNYEFGPSLRGILFKYEDYQGTASTEWIRY